MNFHDPTGELTACFNLHAGDDAGAVSKGIVTTFVAVTVAVGVVVVVAVVVAVVVVVVVIA